MKIAAITDDGKTISMHFGRAAHYMVMTVEDGRITASELRAKLGHNQFASQAHEEPVPGQPHGMGSASHDKHLQMSEVIADCETLLCRGMGRGAYISMEQRNIRPVVTDITNIEEAVLAYVRGEIVDHVEKLH
jgi:predicted Fe-Mo cluster-binding NifX family protein